MPFILPRLVPALALLAVTAGGTAPHVLCAPPRCDAPENRQFDFWAGEWDVTDAASGAPAGTNAITTILGGCVLQERWRGADGGEGSSFNIYDRADAKWHQVWVDSRGVRLDLSGGLRDGKMVLDGPERKTPRGTVVRDRITWTPLPDGRVRQHWEQSQDGGAHWSDAFDGLYARRGARG